MTSTPSSTPTELPGLWELRTFAVHVGDETLHPHGERCRGLLLFSPEGRFSAHQFDDGRPRFAGSDQWSGTEAEIRAAYNGYTAYYGRYRVFPDEIPEDMPAELAARRDAGRALGTIRLQAEGSLFPNWIGGEQLRWFALAGDDLTLVAPAVPVRGTERTAVLDWVRAEGWS